MRINYILFYFMFFILKMKHDKSFKLFIYIYIYIYILIPYNYFLNFIKYKSYHYYIMKVELSVGSMT